MNEPGDQQGEAIREQVRENYGKAAMRAAAGATASCGAGASGCCGPSPASNDPITSNLYRHGETTELPVAAVAASLGCGNPTALAELRAGEVVLGPECEYVPEFYHPERGDCILSARLSGGVRTEDGSDPPPESLAGC
ncbi:MAG: hypothetical protein IVW56_07695 [Candidatus Binataceae bacterium]|nr:hypothetical protein [Candidatus Binataceae bacterium]